MTKPMNFPRRKEERLKRVLEQRKKEDAPLIELEGIQRSIDAVAEKHFTKKRRG